jgi:hypothetical protein
VSYEALFYLSQSASICLIAFASYELRRMRREAGRILTRQDAEIRLLHDLLDHETTKQCPNCHSLSDH